MAISIEVRVPDIGDFKDIPVIELLVKPGDLVQINDPIATLESDKATLDVPASIAGRVISLRVAPGTRVSQGTVLLTLEPSSETEAHPTASNPFATERLSSPPQQPPLPPPPTVPAAPEERASQDAPVSQSPGPAVASTSGRIYASPSIRRVGKELGVDLTGVLGSGQGGRILAEDVHQYVRARMTEKTASADATAWPRSIPAAAVDFSKFGEIERQKLSRIRRISGPALTRNWATIPHVTNFDEADTTDLEKFRVTINAERPELPKLTLLSFLVKACASTLKTLPNFNASIDGEEIILKKYVNVGVAVDTPGGLLVPVLRNADQMGLGEIATILSAKAALARNGKLQASDMEGGCFTISSLGGVGGSGFTPIINAPELAILGVGKAKTQPVWDGEAFLPRLVVPLSLSWDHRALDGVAAARFLVNLVRLLEDSRRLLL